MSLTPIGHLDLPITTSTVPGHLRFDLDRVLSQRPDPVSHRVAEVLAAICAHEDRVAVQLSEARAR